MSSTISVLRPKRPAPRWIAFLSHLFRAYEQGIGDADQPGEIPRFRFFANFVEVWGLQALVLLAVRFLAPGFWHAQLQDGPLVAFLTFLGFGFFMTGPAEWFFHRFGLHRLLAFRGLSWLRIVPEDGGNRAVRAWQRACNTLTITIVYYVARMAFGHGAHHKITDVTPINPGRLAELQGAINRYEITTNRQTEDAVFPHFSVVGFWLVFVPIAALLQAAAGALVPSIHLPLVLMAMISMTFQVWLYEASHAIMHRPFAEWWLPRIKKPVFGWFYSYVYRFHFFHHMNESCSLGVVGSVWFCYFWDRVFGTYKLARLELIESASRVQRDVLEMSKEELTMLPDARVEDFEAPGPKQRWIAYLDRQAAESQEIWNGLFVASLREVRRRAQAPAGAAERLPAAPRARKKAKPGLATD